MAGKGKKNPFLTGFLIGLFTGLALAIVFALLVTRNNPFVQSSATQGAGTSGKASDTPPIEAPKYEFYQAPSSDQGQTAPAATVPGYFLQAGAYGNAADADQLKARLALLGFEAKILITNEDGKMLHKVRLGPYKSLDELNSARARLTQNSIETILVKTQ